jgi:hypothetical protein
VNTRHIKLARQQLLSANSLLRRFSKHSALLSLSIVVGFVMPNQALRAEGPSIAVGESTIAPELRLDYVVVDNTFNTPTNPVESTGVLISPSFSWAAQQRFLSVDTSYAGKYGTYSESILDFYDHDLRVRVQAEPRIRHRGFAELVINSSHEQIGTGQTALESDVTAQIVVTDVILQAGYIYGVKTGKGNAGFGLAVGTKEFRNEAALTDGDDNTLVRPYAFFSYRLSPDTKLHTEIRYKVRNFDDSRRDRHVLSLLTGLDLAPTARTGGVIRFGIANANYDLAGVAREVTLVSQVNLYFKPRSYSRFDFNFSRDFATLSNADNGALKSIQSRANVKWTHDWTGRFSTTASLGLNLDDQICPSLDTSRSTAGLEFDVKIRRWISVGAGFQNSRLKIEDCSTADASTASDSDRSTIGLYLRATL